MESHEEARIVELAPANPAINEAYEEHCRLKAEVAQLTKKGRPKSAKDELKTRELQKLKLAVKDKLMRMLAEYQRDEVG
jgi:uncharacterized protein YdcH (DUF465 family)